MLHKTYSHHLRSICVHANLRPLFKSLVLTTLLCANYMSNVCYAGEIDNLRGARYCEVIIAENRWTLLVYNSIGLNDCPEQSWKKINTESVQKETASSWVHLNGPRYWVIDSMKKAALINHKQRSFGKITMREAGMLHLSLSDILHGTQPYLTHTVHRKTTWVFKADKPVYEIINNKGQVFVMQSYSVQHVHQTEASLANLGKKLSLPAGWRFRTGTLKQDQELPTVDNKAVVIQDNYSNTYQLAPHDFLN